MKDITMSFWFWLLIIGIFLILAAALLAGGLKEANGWVWGFFIAGIIISILGIILAIVEWNRPCKINKKYTSNNVSTSAIATPMESIIDSPTNISF